MIKLFSKKRRNDKFVLAIDVGSYKTCSLFARLLSSGFEILNFSSCTSKGIKKGNLLDKDGVLSCINKVIDGLVINENTDVILSVPSILTTYVNKRHSIAIKKKHISREHITKLLETAYSSVCNDDIALIHLIPQAFYVDDVCVNNPLNLEGDILDMQSMMILSKHHKGVEEMLSVFKKIGIDITYLLLCQISSYLSTISDDERDKVVLLVDIGGGKTEIGVFKGGSLVYFSCLPIGGNHFTNDLSIGLGLPFNECERIKKVFNEVYINPEEESEIEVICFDGSVKTVTSTEIFSIINPRAEETLLLIKRELKRFGIDTPLQSAIITGGVANMKGLSSFAEDILEIPVRIGKTTLLNDEGHEVFSKRQEIFDELKKPDFANVVGSVIYAIDLLREQKAKTKSSRLHFLKSIFN